MNRYEMMLFVTLAPADQVAYMNTQYAQYWQNQYTLWKLRKNIAQLREQCLSLEHEFDEAIAKKELVLEQARKRYTLTKKKCQELVARKQAEKEAREEARKQAEEEAHEEVRWEARQRAHQRALQHKADEFNRRFIEGFNRVLVGKPQSPQ